MAHDAATPAASSLAATDTAGLATETPNLASRNLDQMTPLQIVELMNQQDAHVIAAVQAELPHIAEAVTAIADKLRAGGRLIYIGAGTSGRMGVLDASECPPTFDTPPSMVVGLIAGGPPALVSSVEEAEDDAVLGEYDVRQVDLSPADVLVGISASGRTPYVMGALSYARQLGVTTVGIACNKGSAFESVVDILIAPDTGPEVVAGSTRLKAGTAQKLVLNMLSTATMVQLGKTFGNLMVDVRPTNAKLRRRAAQIVATATGFDLETAAAKLAECDGETRTAIVALLNHVSPAEARVQLAASNGKVRNALR